MEQRYGLEVLAAYAKKQLELPPVVVKIRPAPLSEEGLNAYYEQKEAVYKEQDKEAVQLLLKALEAKKDEIMEQCAYGYHYRDYAEVDVIVVGQHALEPHVKAWLYDHGLSPQWPISFSYKYDSKVCGLNDDIMTIRIDFPPPGDAPIETRCTVS